MVQPPQSVPDQTPSPAPSTETEPIENEPSIKGKLWGPFKQHPIKTTAALIAAASLLIMPETTGYIAGKLTLGIAESVIKGFVIAMGSTEIGEFVTKNANSAVNSATSTASSATANNLATSKNVSTLENWVTETHAGLFTSVAAAGFVGLKLLGYKKRGALAGATIAATLLWFSGMNLKEIVKSNPLYTIEKIVDRVSRVPGALLSSEVNYPQYAPKR